MKMVTRSLLFLALANLLQRGGCLSPEFVACQVQKPFGISPLLGCPAGTIFVSQDVNDKHARFHSVQDAVLSLYVQHFPEVLTVYFYAMSTGRN
jgi:hypothetical protein